jgi:hypothetical protein
VKPQPDPDPSRTEKVVTALRALGKGGKAIADSPVLTPGARADFAQGGTMQELAGMRSLVFLMERDAAGLKIERHKGAVNRILHYRLVTDKTDRCLLIHMTADGLVTDFDIVED